MGLLQSMKLFAKLAELGSFTKAADAMGTGRPQVTVAIQELDATLGVRLFHRTPRRVNLTAEGERVYECVEEILGNVAEVTSMFVRSGSAPAGRLRVDIPAAFAQQRFIDGLRSFGSMAPATSIREPFQDGRVLALVHR